MLFYFILHHPFRYFSVVPCRRLRFRLGIWHIERFFQRNAYLDFFTESNDFEFSDRQICRFSRFGTFLMEEDWEQCAYLTFFDIGKIMLVNFNCNFIPIWPDSCKSRKVPFNIPFRNQEQIRTIWLIVCQTILIRISLLWNRYFVLVIAYYN